MKRHSCCYFFIKCCRRWKDEGHPLFVFPVVVISMMTGLLFIGCLSSSIGYIFYLLIPMFKEKVIKEISTNQTLDVNQIPTYQILFNSGLLFLAVLMMALLGLIGIFTICTVIFSILYGPYLIFTGCRDECKRTIHDIDLEDHIV